MPERLNDWRDGGPSLPQESRRALTSALLRDVSSVAALATSVCDCVRELRATGASPEETHAAVRELVAEHRMSNDGDREGGDVDAALIDAMVVSCLDGTRLAIA